LEELALRRRATPHFTAEPVPEEIIDTALTIASQAPSGYNFQPWRFLVLTDPGQRQRLKDAAFSQEKIGEAPVVIVAFGQRDAWKDPVDEIFEMRARRNDRAYDRDAAEATKQNAFAAIAKLPTATWLNRQVMIAFTYLMLAVEAQGWDTAPMEGFDPAAVRKAFDLPSDTEVVALLAIGRAADPDPPHPGRLPVSRIACRNRLGQPLTPFNESES
jgi:nitroreductase